MTYLERKVVADGVFILEKGIHGEESVQHQCPGRDRASQMTLRENEDGPLYWCKGCGYILEEGVSMAIRLNEVDL